MSKKVILTQTFLRKAKKLMSKDELGIAEAAIMAAPNYWPVIAGTGGARKARIPLGTKGKSGGGRLVYYWRSQAGDIYFITVYAKNEKENLSEDDKKIIRTIIKVIEDDKKP